METIIGIDLDSTLIETHAAAVAAKELGYMIHNKDVTRWNHLNFPDDLRKKIMEYFLDPVHMCDEARPIERTQETIKRWTSAGHKIVLITARAEPIRIKTVEMVQRLFPEITDVNFVGMDQSKKSVMLDKKINFWVDDAPHGVLDSLSIDIKTILVSNAYTKYNWDVKTDTRLHEVVKIIADIKEF
jgi:hypothetical protein